MDGGEGRGKLWGPFKGGGGREPIFGHIYVKSRRGRGEGSRGLDVGGTVP